MNKYYIILLVFFILYLMASALAIGISKRKDTVIIKSRGKKTGNTRRSAQGLKKQMSSMLDEKADVNKKYKVETMCIQAGHPMTYGEFKIMSYTIAIILPLIMLMGIHNVLLAFVFAFIGYHIPGQLFKAKSNSRIQKMESQVGSFLRIVIERYKNQEDMSKAIAQTLPDFKGSEPFYTELKQAVIDMNKGETTEEVIESLARRTGNKYLKRFSDYYKISANIATHQNKVELLNQAFTQYEKNRKLKALLKEKISGPVREAYIMVFATPIFMVYQSFATEGYLDFMLNEPVGQAGIAGVVLVLLGCVWFINAKIGAPVD